MSHWMIFVLSGISFSGTRNVTSTTEILCLMLYLSIRHWHISELRKRKGYSFKVSRLPATSVVRSRTLQQTDGMLKAIINSHSGKIMGCTLFCTDAPELINMVAMAMKTGQTSTFLRDFIFTHPSMSEGLNQLFDV